VGEREEKAKDNHQITKKINKKKTKTTKQNKKQKNKKTKKTKKSIAQCG